MARRREVEPHKPEDGVPILPRHLVAKGLTAAEYRQQTREQNAWFLGHGINPGNWRKVHPVLKASWKAHGMEDSGALARARLRVSDKEPS